jgi:hypothetical protein
LPDAIENGSLIVAQGKITAYNIRGSRFLLWLICVPQYNFGNQSGRSLPVRHSASLLAVFILVLANQALADDQQKAKKELNKITAMATDATGRNIVNQSLSEMISIKRMDLVQQRRETGLNYGSLLLAYELTKLGVDMKEIVARLKSGKDIFQIANDANIKWKEICDRAKKLNSKIDDNLYKHFLHPKDDKVQARVDDYNIIYDGVKADNDVSQMEIDQAQARYLLWLDRASPNSDKRLGTADEKAASYDHVRSGGPHGASGNSSGGLAPAAGGIPQ